MCSFSSWSQCSVYPQVSSALSLELRSVSNAGGQKLKISTIKNAASIFVCIMIVAWAHNMVSKIFASIRYKGT